jgi:hypothetical protein
MGLVEAWMFRRWPKPAPPASLTLDMEAGRLGGIALRSPAKALAEVLGAPASYREMRRGRWVYPQLGVGFEEEEGKLITIALVFSHPELSPLWACQDTFRPFTGQVRFRHGPQRAAGLQEPLLREALGAPISEDRDEEEVVVRFRRGDVEVEAEFTPEGALKLLSLFAP